MTITPNKNSQSNHRPEKKVEKISYKKGYKYQLTADYSSEINIQPDRSIDSDYISLTASGRITIKDGYAWDGPSGPLMDTLNFMRGSLVHDALYQLMRGGALDKDSHRKDADQLLRKICREDGMGALRAWMVYTGVRYLGESFADPANKKRDFHAP